MRHARGLMRTDPRVRPAYAALLASVGTFVFLAGMMNTIRRGWPAWYRLANRGASAPATVTAVMPQDHTTCYFEFMVGSQKYTSFDHPCRAHKGDVLTITYDPANPSSAAIQSASTELGTEILACLVMSVVAGAIGFRQSSAEWRRTTTRASLIRNPRLPG